MSKTKQAQQIQIPTHLLVSRQDMHSFERWQRPVASTKVQVACPPAFSSSVNPASAPAVMVSCYIYCIWFPVNHKKKGCRTDLGEFFWYVLLARA